MNTVALGDVRFPGGEELAWVCCLWFLQNQKVFFPGLEGRSPDNGVAPEIKPFSTYSTSFICFIFSLSVFFKGVCMVGAPF